MKILHLPIEKKWFDKIFFADKKEEYRDIKPYYTSRLNKPFDCVEFRNGYGKNVPKGLIELKEILIDYGKVKWGAEKGKKYYVLKLGNIIKSPHEWGWSKCVKCGKKVNT